MSEDELYRVTYNTHERAEQEVLLALVNYLHTAPLEALMCLCDPEWEWENRSPLSRLIIDEADEALNARLNALVAA